jgi:hypothetical protein
MNPSDAGKKGFEKTGHILRENWEEKSLSAQEAYNADPKLCPVCNKVIPYEKRYNTYCNHSCAAVHRNTTVVRTKKHLSRNCPHCGNPVSNRHNQYCDECIKNAVYNKAQSLDGMKSDRGRRHFLIRERGHQCESCSNSEWLGIPIALELDHIDGNPDNNTAENLRLLCPNCHAQTEFYKGAAATKGKGRHSIRRQKRRERYENGDSY